MVHEGTDQGLGGRKLDLKIPRRVAKNTRSQDAAHSHPPYTRNVIGAGVWGWFPSITKGRETSFGYCNMNVYLAPKACVIKRSIKPRCNPLHTFLFIIDSGTSV